MGKGKTGSKEKEQRLRKIPAGIRRGERNVQITNSGESGDKHWHKLGRKREVRGS